MSREALWPSSNESKREPRVERGGEHEADPRRAGTKGWGWKARPTRMGAGGTGWRDGCPRASRKGARISKIGVVASQVEAVGKHGRHRRSQRRYVATFGPAEEVGMLSYAAAYELGATEAKQQGVLGDGAQWIKTQTKDHFPEAVKILDWSHLWRKMRDAVRAVQPGKRAARRKWRKEQYELFLPLLWAGEREQALKHMASPVLPDRRSASCLRGCDPLLRNPTRLDRQL